MLNIGLIAAAFGGGAFGAAIGALPAFVFTGIAVLVGVAAALAGADFDFIGTIAFGPVFGPHIAFAGGVAAAAFAARRGKLSGGRDIATGLMGLGDPIVLVVGGLFGILGLVVVALLNHVLQGITDTVALTVVLSALLARLAFGTTGIFGTLTEEARRRGRFRPGGGQVWLAYQQEWPQVIMIGLAAGLVASFITVELGQAAPQLAGLGPVLAFGISAASLVFLQVKVTVPVTHHITLIAGLAALHSGSIWIGALFGVLAAVLGELSSRLMLIHGDTHIDPPANAIWIATLLIVLIF